VGLPPWARQCKGYDGEAFTKGDDLWETIEPIKALWVVHAALVNTRFSPLHDTSRDLFIVRAIAAN